MSESNIDPFEPPRTCAGCNTVERTFSEKKNWVPTGRRYVRQDDRFVTPPPDGNGVLCTDCAWMWPDVPNNRDRS